MIINIVIGVLALLFVGQNYGFSFVSSASIYYLVFFLIVNISFMVTLGSIKKYIELFRVTLIKGRETHLKKEELLKMNAFLVILNILFGLLGSLIVRIAMFKYMADPTVIGSYTSASLSFIMYSLVIIGLIFIPQRFVLSNSVVYHKDIKNNIAK